MTDRPAASDGPRADAGTAQTGVDTTVPHSARIWNYWLGGKDNFASTAPRATHGRRRSPACGGGNYVVVATK